MSESSLATEPAWQVSGATNLAGHVSGLVWRSCAVSGRTAVMHTVGGIDSSVMIEAMIGVVLWVEL